MPAIYAVIGATGATGGAVVAALANSGSQVRAVTRNPNSGRARELSQEGVDVVAADLSDEDALTRAFTGVAGVFAITTRSKKARMPRWNRAFTWSEPPHRPEYHTSSSRLVGARIDVASDAPTPRHMATAIEQALGRPIELVTPDPAGIASPDMRAMFTYLSEHGYSADIDTLRENYPDIGWQRFGEWVSETL